MNSAHSPWKQHTSAKAPGDLPDTGTCTIQTAQKIRRTSEGWPWRRQKRAEFLAMHWPIADLRHELVNPSG